MMSLLLGLWISFACIFVGPGYFIASLHLVFIGGLSVVIFMIATRISLAHGGYNLAFEYKSKFYQSWMILILSSLGFRVFGFIWPAVFIWLLSTGVWVLMVWTRTVKISKDSFGTMIADK
jgi:uncharacterized protein involved in response to NO